MVAYRYTLQMKEWDDETQPAQKNPALGLPLVQPASSARALPALGALLVPRGTPGKVYHLPHQTTLAANHLRLCCYALHPSSAGYQKHMGPFGYRRHRNLRNSLD